MVLGCAHWNSTIWIRILFSLHSLFIAFCLLLHSGHTWFVIHQNSIQIKALVKYLKPFIDVYQAPYKTNSRYLSCIALIVRGVALSVTSLSTSRVLAINLILRFLYLAYFSLHQPFKSQVNQCIYISYLCNLGCVPILTYASTPTNRKR